MKSRRTFALSLLLNLALTGLAAWLAARQRGGAVAEERSAVLAAIAPDASDPSSLATTNATLTVSYVTNRFDWKQLESADFEELAVNLRAIGCPEKTIHDVVVARARRALTRLALRAEPSLPFWTAGLRRERANRVAEQEVSAAREKIIVAVERVIGQGRFTEDTQMMEDYVGQAIVRFFSGPISEERFSRMAVVLTRQESRQREIESRAQGVRLEADEAALADCRRQFHLELASVLSPTELEEFVARGAGMGLAEQVLFEATDLTTTEIRQLALLHGQVRDPFDGDFMFGGGSPSDEEKEQFYALVRQRFGEARFVQIERAADDDFKTLSQLSREHNLPRDVAAAVFELGKLTAQEIARLHEDKSLPDSERRQRLAAMQAETREAIVKLLGAKAAAQYFNQNGASVTNVNGL